MSIDFDHNEPPAEGQPLTEGLSPAGSPAEEPRRKLPLTAIIVAVAAVVVIAGAGTASIAVVTSSLGSSTSDQNNSFTFPGSGFAPQGGTGDGSGQGGLGNQAGPSAPGGNDSGSSLSSVTPATAATAAQKVGIVTIDTVLNYDSKEQAAGTGMILTSNGLILTNNHVVEGATSIKVTVESTNASYTATVVGTDTTADVAVLKLKDATGLTPVAFDSSATVRVGDSVYSVGNAAGTGNLVTATGTVAAVGQTLTVQSDFSTAGETLSGLIQVKSDVVSGDSGGPLFDARGRVIGIITAASTGGNDVSGFAINIPAVLTVASQIERGAASSTVTIGTPAFLGVNIGTATTRVGVPIQGAIAGMPAANAGITGGSVITSVDGHAATTADGLSALIHSYAPGTRVTVAWTDAAGAKHTTAVTLVAGPAA